MIRVLLADDQTLVRAAFAMLVESAPDMEVVGQAGTGREAVELAHSERADLVVMDIRMPPTWTSDRGDPADRPPPTTDLRRQ
ncbi:Protein-glutamate methylesterase/protein-glutamine glutaminase [Streptomyces glaucescens]